MPNESILNVNEIMDLLPHRHPFLLIDRVLEVEPGESILAYKNISISEDVFNGHFPGAPIFPGVMIIVAMAQASGILGFITSKQKATDGKLYLFAGVDKARFKRPVVPGDQLMITSKIEAVKRNIWTLLCAYQDRDSVA